MQVSADMSPEDLVRIMHNAYLVGDETLFKSAADVLEQRYRQYIARKVAQKLRPANLLHLAKDAAGDIIRRILEDVRSTRLKRNMDNVFELYLNEACRDTLETFLRHEGIPVPTRHTNREGRLPARPNTVPPNQQVSINAPISEEDEATLEDTIIDPHATDDLVIDRLERLERMRSLSPEQRMMVAIYGDFIDRKLKAPEIAARRSISIAEVKRQYTEACRILQMAKERNHE